MAQKDKETRDKILHSAKKEFSRRGFEGARMAEIADKAHINKALIHYYFKNKENLYVEVLKRIFGENDDYEIPQYPGKWDLTPAQKLYVIVYFITKIHLKATDPDADRILFWELAEGKKYLTKIIAEYAIPRQKILLNIIEEGIKKGEFETTNPLLSVLSLFSFISIYAVSKDLYKDTPMYSALYGESGEKEIFHFSFQQIFKSLRPADKPLAIPVVPADLMTFIDHLFEMMKKKKDEGGMGGVVRQLARILGE